MDFLELKDGRKKLYQWDIGSTANVSVECSEVHFSNMKFGDSIPVDVIDKTVIIPNEVLTSGMDVYCYAFVKDNDGFFTKKETVFKVEKRPKPSGYIYEPSDVVSVEEIVKKEVGDIQEDIVSFFGIQNEVYFDDFSEAISSIKNNSVFNDENKTKSKDSVCMVHEDSVNQRMVVTLLSDVSVNEEQEITFDFEINFNGYTINTVVDTERFHLFNVKSGSVTVNGKSGGGVNATVKNVGNTVMVFSVRNAAPLFVDGGLYTITEENGSGAFVFGCSGDTVIKNTRIEMTCSTKSSGNDDSAIFVDGNCNAKLENNKINIVNFGKGTARGYTVAKANKLICSNNTINADARDNDAHSGNGTSVGGEIKSGVLAAFLTDEKLHGEFVGLRMNAKKSHICGGVYTSTSHGGIYFEVRDIVSFVENATMGCVEYSGIFVDSERSNKAMGAFYIGGNDGENNMTVYMDNCVLYGFCDAINKDTGEFVNDGPVISGRSGQSINHTLYISNTNLAVNPITGTLNDVRLDWGSRLVVGENTNITLDRIDTADTEGTQVNTETVVTFTDRRFSEDCVRAYEQIADWSENNPDSPNYVKNRTHWMETFPPIEWDGSTEGKDSFDASALGFGKFYKVSDQVWTKSQAENCETYTINADGTKDAGFPYDSILLDEEEIGFAVSYSKNSVGIVAFFAKQAVDLTSIYGFKIPSAGCYFYQTTLIDWNGGVFGLERQPEPRKLDSKFLPDSVLTDSKLYPLINYSELYDDSISVEIDGEFTDCKFIIGTDEETNARILDAIKKKQARVIVRFDGDYDEENVFSCNIVLSESKKNGVLFGDCAVNQNGKKIHVTLELGIKSNKLTENVFRIWAESAATIDNILSMLPVYNGEVEE